MQKTAHAREEEVAPVGPPAATSRQRRPLQSLARSAITPPLGMFIVGVLAWKAVTVLFEIQPFIIPPPEAVLVAAGLDGIYLLGQLGHTAAVSLAGFFLAAAVGIITGILFSQSKLIRKALFPYAILMQVTPVVAIAPLIVLWFGIGDKSIIVIAFIISLFPIIANSTLGLMSVDKNLINLFEMSNATRWQKLKWLQLPYSLPHIFAGLRISSGLAVIGGIIGEFLVGTGGRGGGMGYTLIIAAAQLRTDRMFLGIAMTAALGVTLFGVVGMIADRTLRNWHESAIIHEN